MKGFEIELMLLGWSESHNNGCKVTFAVDNDGLERFKSATERKGKIAGQIYMAVLVPVDQDDLRRPVNVRASILGGVKPVGETAEFVPPVGFKQEPDGSFSRECAPTLREPGTFDGERVHKAHFPDGLCGLAVRWCGDAHFQAWIAGEFFDEVDAADKSGEELAKAIICALCKIDSRKQLDTAPGAEMIFRAKILEPYAEVRRLDHLDDKPF